jgi:hypothetical protein
MNFRPKIRILSVLLILGVVFFGASLAQAGSSHHHHADVVSPFDKIQKIKPLHCVLNMHQHLLNTPCPHKDQNEKNAGQVIRSECGSSTGTANSSASSIAKNLFKDINQDGFFSLQFYSRIKPPSDIFSRNYPRSIDHPPQFI